MPVSLRFDYLLAGMVCRYLDANVRHVELLATCFALGAQRIVLSNKAAAASQAFKLHTLMLAVFYERFSKCIFFFVVYAVRLKGE